MLERLTATSFAPAVGDTFALDGGEAGRLELELVGGSPARPGCAGGGRLRLRAPFTLEFRGPLEPVLPQRIYALEHPSLGPLEIFIVPVGRDEAGTTYEAVFS